MVGAGLPVTQRPGAALEPGYLLPTRQVRAVVTDVPTELVVSRVVPRVLLGRGFGIRHFLVALGYNPHPLTCTMD